ncbi:hypothetical protein TNCV_1186981 [Trichonephila clavipes]|nr:hypothetical protein TNCV_1186981 [Trichonephila clavipes]
MTQILVFRSEGAKVYSSFIGDPHRAKRTAAVMVPSVHRKCNQAIRHITQPAKPSHTTTQPTSCLTQNDATAYTLATNMVSFVRLFSKSLAEEYCGDSVHAMMVILAWWLRYSFSDRNVPGSNLPSDIPAADCVMYR